MAYIIGLCGIDGAGKTTVAKMMVQELRAQGVLVRYRHELDFPGVRLLISLFQVVLGHRRTQAVKEKVLEGKEHNQPLVSSLYHLLVWLESLVSYVWFKLVPGVVVHDRWPYDFLLQFRQRQYQNYFIHGLFKRFPRPNMLIQLTLPYHVAYQRKGSDPAHIHHGLEYFRDLAYWVEDVAQHIVYDKVVSSEPPAEEVVKAIIELLPDWRR